MNAHSKYIPSMSIEKVNDAVGRILPLMFYHNGEVSAKVVEGQPWPAASEIIVCISLSGELFDTHILVGFERELLHQLISAVIDSHSSGEVYEKIADSAACEFANQLASELASDKSFFARFGKLEIGCPRLWDAETCQEMYIPFEHGERGLLETGGMCIDTFASYVLHSNQPQINYSTDLEDAEEEPEEPHSALGDSLAMLKKAKTHISIGTSIKLD